MTQFQRPRPYLQRLFMPGSLSKRRKGKRTARPEIGEKRTFPFLARPEKGFFRVFFNWRRLTETPKRRGAGGGVSAYFWGLFFPWNSSRKVFPHSTLSLLLVHFCDQNFLSLSLSSSFSWGVNQEVTHTHTRRWMWFFWCVSFRRRELLSRDFLKFRNVHVHFVGNPSIQNLYRISNKNQYKTLCLVNFLVISPAGLRCRASAWPGSGSPSPEQRGRPAGGWWACRGGGRRRPEE